MSSPAMSRISLTRYSPVVNRCAPRPSNKNSAAPTTSVPAATDASETRSFAFTRNSRLKMAPSVPAA
ncbi:MAG: hypothetical protein A2138_26125 [Deltaproteobacteria bacterium RBG_16_71_12]|nr:MAG: hypothetical protein A2138_26125 [Deltaproteobacteria bacterium RBG_16_71_12]